VPHAEDVPSNSACREVRVPSRGGRVVHPLPGRRRPPVPAGSASRVAPGQRVVARRGRAVIAYWEPGRALEIFRHAGFKCEYVEGDTTNCYLAWQARWLLVAFRGTQPDQWQDVLDDLKVGPVVVREGRVHAGFNDALDRVWSQLQPRLAVLGAGRTGWFCRHSLGAALATLAAQRYASTRSTFGSPRVGDAEFVAAFNRRFAGRSWRVVNDHDVVTHVPPRELLGAYFEHADAGRFIDAGTPWRRRNRRSRITSATSLVAAWSCACGSSVR
jgi:Lipase (class 3)